VKRSASSLKLFTATSVLAALVLVGSSAEAKTDAVSDRAAKRGPVSISNLSLQAFVASKDSRTMVVPGVRAVVDFWAMEDDSKEQDLWLHGVVGTSGGFGGSGKTSAELYMAFGASYAPHPLAALGFLYEPLGYWTTPVSGVFGSGVDLRLRVWRVQLELGRRGQDLFKGFATGEIKQDRIVVKALLPRAWMASIEHYPAVTGRDSSTNFVLGFAAF
jgi:hypothetical protein